MMDEWHHDGSEIVPWILKLNYQTPQDFEKLIKKINNAFFGLELENFPACLTYFAINEQDKIIGAVNIRRYLNNELLKANGHIGYGVRPTERNKGYATEMLKMALAETKAMKMPKVLLGAYEDNLASCKVIEKCGGKLDNIITEESTSKIFKRYWLEN